MLATSLATMLEPGYLGDVLKAMTAAFETASDHAPAILFIDEFENIGKRSGGGDRNAEYWNSVVNRMLELLDGVTRTEGVIVVAATNFSDRIDPALLRSGRLETRIDFPLPTRPHWQAFLSIIWVLILPRSSDAAPVIAADASRNRGARSSSCNGKVGAGQGRRTPFGSGVTPGRG